MDFDGVNYAISSNVVFVRCYIHKVTRVSSVVLADGMCVWLLGTIVSPSLHLYFCSTDGKTVSHI